MYFQLYYLPIALIADRTVRNQWKMCIGDGCIGTVTLYTPENKYIRNFYIDLYFVLQDVSAYASPSPKCVETLSLKTVDREIICPQILIPAFGIDTKTMQKYCFFGQIQIKSTCQLWITSMGGCIYTWLWKFCLRKNQLAAKR